MGHHAGDALHYHGAGKERYGHRHPFLSIMHEHDEPPVPVSADTTRGTEDVMGEKKSLLNVLGDAVDAARADRARPVSADTTRGTEDVMGETPAPSVTCGVVFEVARDDARREVFGASINVTVLGNWDDLADYERERCVGILEHFLSYNRTPSSENAR